MRKMERLLGTAALATGIVVATAVDSAAQKRVEMETTADEVVTLWDNTTAKHSNYETKAEVFDGT